MNNILKDKKANKMRNKIRRWFYSSWYNHDFKFGYSYQRISHTNLTLLEKHHYLMIDLGWDKDGDVKTGFLSAYCWYRKTNNHIKTLTNE